MDNRLIFLYQCMNDGVTEKVIASRLLDSGLSIKIDKLANPLILRSRCEYERTLRVLVKLHISCFQEKLLVYHTLTVPRTNTRGQGEYPKASELTIVKELCKLIP